MTAPAVVKESLRSNALIVTKKAAVEDPKFCLKESNDSLGLDSTHSYYYQIQMFVFNVKYSVFYVCTFANDDEEGIHIEERWVLSRMCLQAEHFFKSCLLPELTTQGLM